MAIKAGPMGRGHIDALMERGLRKVFFEEFKLRGSQYREIYSIQSSQKRQETDAVMSGLSTYRRKTEGQSPYFDSAQQAYTKVYSHSTFSLGLEITEEGMEDDLYGFYEDLSRELARAAYYTQEVEAADIFNDLSAPICQAGGQSYPLLSVNHYRQDDGVWANRPSVGLDLGIDSLELMLTMWRTGMVDQRGRKIAPSPSILLVGPGDEFMAHRLLNTDKRPQGSDNDVNAVRARRSLRVVVWDFMTDDGRFFLLGNPGETGLLYFQRVKHQMKRRDDGRTGNLLMVGRYRESHGATHPVGILGTP